MSVSLFIGKNENKKECGIIVKFAIKISVVYIFIPLNLVVFMIIIVVMKILV